MQAVGGGGAVRCAGDVCKTTTRAPLLAPSPSLRNQESQPPPPPASGTSPSQGAEAMWSPASSSWGPPFPPPAPDQSQLLLPASQCQPLFRKCQVLSDLSANTLLVSVMLMGSQMCVCVRRLRGARTRAWPRNRQATASAWLGAGQGWLLGVSDQPGDIGSFLLDIPGPPLQPRSSISRDTAALKAG